MKGNGRDFSMPKTTDRHPAIMMGKGELCVFLIASKVFGHCLYKGFEDKICVSSVCCLVHFGATKAGFEPNQT